MKCFHHNDLDGKGAASCVLRYLQQRDEAHRINKADYISVNYKNSVPDASFVEPGETIYIVDYSFTEPTKGQLDGILKIASKVIWLDHHASSVEFLEAHPEYNNVSNLDMVIDTTRSGALIAYQYLFPYKEIPRYIILIDDYDRWVHRYKESMHFKLAMDMQYDNPYDLVWYQLYHTEFYTVLDRLIDAGETIEEYCNGINKKDFKSMSYETEVFGYKCIIMNKRGNSTALAGALDKYPIGIIWSFDGTTYSYSIYSTNKDIKCNKIAEMFGGGGHPGAAGFTSTRLLFTKDSIWIAEIKSHLTDEIEFDVNKIGPGLLEFSPMKKYIEMITLRDSGEMISYKTLEYKEEFNINTVSAQREKKQPSTPFELDDKEIERCKSYYEKVIAKDLPTTKPGRCEPKLIMYNELGQGEVIRPAVPFEVTERELNVCAKTPKYYLGRKIAMAKDHYDTPKDTIVIKIPNTISVKTLPEDPIIRAGMIDSIDGIITKGPVLTGSHTTKSTMLNPILTKENAHQEIY